MNPRGTTRYGLSAAPGPCQFPRTPACPQKVGSGCQRKSGGRKIGSSDGSGAGEHCEGKDCVGSVRDTMLGAKNGATVPGAEVL